MASNATFYNPSGGLTFSGDGVTYSYVGRATFQNTQQPFGSLSDQRLSGYSTYTISWPGDIVVALPLNTAGSSVLIGTSQSNGVWTIKVHCGTTVQDSYGFETETSTIVYVFGAPPANATSIFLMSNSQGVPCADLSRRPLTCKGVMAMGDNQTTASVPAGPVGILGASPDNYYQYLTDQSGPYVMYRSRAWHLNTNTGLLERNLYSYQALRSSFTLATLDTRNACWAVYVDLTGL